MAVTVTTAADSLRAELSTLRAGQCRLSDVLDDAPMKTTNATTSTPQSNPRPTRNHRRRNLLVAACVLGVLAFTSCTAAQRRELGEQDVHDSLMSHVNQALNDRSLGTSDALDCTATITIDSHVSASCVGAPASGHVVAASFTGTADVNAETCTAALTVDIDGERVVDDPSVQCFATA
jgi:hypothetical protein